MRSVFLLGDNVIPGTAFVIGVGGLIALIIVGLITGRLVLKAWRDAQPFTERGLIVVAWLLGAFIAVFFTLAWLLQP